MNVKIPLYPLATTLRASLVYLFLILCPSSHERAMCALCFWLWSLPPTNVLFPLYPGLSLGKLYRPSLHVPV